MKSHKLMIVYVAQALFYHWSYQAFTGPPACRCGLRLSEFGTIDFSHAAVLWDSNRFFFP